MHSSAHAAHACRPCSRASASVIHTDPSRPCVGDRCKATPIQPDSNCIPRYAAGSAADRCALQGFCSTAVLLSRQSAHTLAKAAY